eukprot:GSMAST32.ASY1.ANO1.2240.1 assembled CDS
MTLLSLPLSETDHSKKEAAVAVGTMLIRPKNEDEEAMGRVVLYSVKHVNAKSANADGVDEEEQQQQTIPVLKVTYEKEFRGGVSAITQMKLRKYIALSSGSKIFLFKWMKESLVGLAFFDGPVYIHSLMAIRDFVVFSDVHKSVQLLRWKENVSFYFFSIFFLLAKDYDPLDSTASSFMINDRQLGLVAADEQSNLTVFNYSPLDVHSRGGHKLLVGADFHLGQKILCMNHRRMLPDRVGRKVLRYASLFGTLDGGIGALVPIDEGVFRRLHNLQRAMVMGLSQNAGLNPWTYRTWREPGGHGCLLRNPKRRIADGVVLWKYPDLDYTMQLNLARCIGSTPEMILDNLMRIDLATILL